MYKFEFKLRDDEIFTFETWDWEKIKIVQEFFTFQEENYWPPVEEYLEEDVEEEEEEEDEEEEEEQE
jgi:hypothetical protein